MTAEKSDVEMGAVAVSITMPLSMKVSMDKYRQDHPEFKLSSWVQMKLKELMHI